MRYLNTILEDIDTTESREVKEIISKKVSEEKVRNKRKERRRYRKKLGFVE